MTAPITTVLPLSASLSGQAIEQHYATPIGIEKTRLLYAGSRLPTLFMLLCGIACAFLLWNQEHKLLLIGWLVWLSALATLRLLQMRAFDRAPAIRQAENYWHRMFLLGAGASGLTLSFAVIFLVPADSFYQQVPVYGLIAASVACASAAYAVSFAALLSFVLPCLLPSMVYLMFSEYEMQQGWGKLCLILLVAMLVVAWQVNRLVQRSLIQRFHNQALLERQEEAKRQAEALNRKLSREVEQRRLAERSLRSAHDQLEAHVSERTRELDEATYALGKSQARLAMALEASELGLWDWDLRTDAVHHSKLQELFGLPQSGTLNMRKDLRPLLHPKDRPLLLRALTAHLRGRTDGYAVEYRVRHADGHWVWVEDRGRAMERDARGRVQRMLGTRRNISARKHREEEQRLAGTVFEAASEGIVILDAQYHVLAVNQAFSEMTGYRREEVLGQSVIRLISTHEARLQYQQIHEHLMQHGRWQGELMETRKNGELYPQWLQLNTVRDRQGRIAQVVGFFADLTTRHQTEERLRYLAHYDNLTGLANRTLFRERLHDAIQRSRSAASRLALLHVDLDRFKVLNDSLGHDIADQLLRRMAQRLTQAVPEADTVSRLSSDEYALIVDGYPSLATLARLASNLLATVRKPLTIDGHELVVSASIGISLFPDNGRELSPLISQANMAMQHAKHLGGNCFQFYTDNLQVTTLERLQLETQLRKGIENGELEVFYQPKLNLADDSIGGAEALVRWRHPQRGLVGPGEFISLAEETGLIGAIGEFVLRQAVNQAYAWHQQGLDVRVSVNVSVHQVRQGNLTSIVRQVLEETHLPARLLELELTESQLLDNVESVIATLHQLHALGIKLAIDDFGTGYSSLSYLKRFPVDYVKIDQTFIRDLSQGGEDAAITRAIIALAHNLELKVVAEGVETQDQLDFLRLQGCDEIQGYLISRPIEALDFVRVLRAHVASPSMA
jgi:diguanylate cyclase (GGDEF)-like protein/PAS domain S-box-containing protein